jgi:hypothetical protein
MHGSSLPEQATSEVVLQNSSSSTPRRVERVQPLQSPWQHVLCYTCAHAACTYQDNDYCKVQGRSCCSLRSAGPAAGAQPLG